jgi:hypothetical protein
MPSDTSCPLSLTPIHRAHTYSSPPGRSCPPSNRAARSSSNSLSAILILRPSYASIHSRSPRPKPRPTNPLPPLPRPHRHHRHQNEMLRHLLRLQRLPRRPSQPSPRTLAPIRMAHASHPLRSLPRRANHLRLPPLQLPLPPMPRPLQPRLP